MDHYSSPPPQVSLPFGLLFHGGLLVDQRRPRIGVARHLLDCLEVGSRRQVQGDKGGPQPVHAQATGLLRGFVLRFSSRLYLTPHRIRNTVWHHLIPLQITYLACPGGEDLASRVFVATGTQDSGFVTVFSVCDLTLPFQVGLIVNLSYPASPGR